MREILFHGKRADNGEWIEGAYISGRWGGSIGHYILPLDEQNAFRVEPFTVGQYTGLTDKNNKRMFEGDILSAYLDEDFPDNESRGVVAWRDFGWVVQTDASPDAVYDVLDDSDHDIWTVIGNIYDNPELIGGGEDGD